MNFETNRLIIKCIWPTLASSGDQTKNYFCNQNLISIYTLGFKFHKHLAVAVFLRVSIVSLSSDPYKIYIKNAADLQC